ncbi:hypothetical protein K431DRAFT_290502 [Polychaeton citri CBS 116435]|uniref:Uncharacterized protein n=1 Tax=Polychaeton citri CBS 116435 TaxID=1314669 RepID=A0A9P4QJE7_9PEZI|nr:hypothetical protein K431DRAFT_290502 [Polychaeton citri CBS 116435]
MSPLTYVQVAAAGLLGKFFAFGGVKVSIYNTDLLQLVDELTREEVDRVRKLPENISLSDDWFDYLGLPSELRYKIFGYTYPNMRLDMHNKDSTILIPPAALVGNHQLRVDTLYLLLREGCISINGGVAHKRFTHWLNKVAAKNNGRPMRPYLPGQYLRFPYFGFYNHGMYSVNADLELAEKCERLADLNLTISERALLQRVVPESELLTPVPVVTLLQKFYFNKVLDLGFLQQLNITCKSTFNGHHWTVRGDQLSEMHEVETHIREKFAGLDRRVHIKHTISGYGYPAK